MPIVGTIPVISEDDKTSWVIDWNKVPHQADDMLLVVICLDDDVGGVGGLTGYTALETPVNGFVRMDTYYKFATTSSEGSVTVTSTALNGRVTGYVIRGIDTTTPVDDTASTTYGGAVTTHVIPAITTTTANCLELVFGAVNQIDTYTQRRDTARGKDLYFSVVGGHTYYGAEGSIQSASTVADESLTVKAQRGAWVHIALRNATGGAKPINFSGGIDYKARAGIYDQQTALSLSTRTATFNTKTVDAVVPVTTYDDRTLSETTLGTGTSTEAPLSGTGGRINGIVFNVTAIDLSGPITFTVKPTSVLNIVPDSHFLYLEDSSGNWVGKNLGITDLSK